MKTALVEMNKRFLVPIFGVLFILSVFSPVKICHIQLVWASPNPIDGLALIVTGSNETEFYDGSKAAYDALDQCGFTIRYLDVIDRGEINPTIQASRANFIYQIQNFLKQNSDSNDIVIISLVDHGGPQGYFGISPTENITYSELNSWISQLNYGRLIIVVDACYSGDALLHLHGENRIIISSTKSNEIGVKGFFSKFFWPNTVNNNPVVAFNDASEVIWDEFEGLICHHHPMLDDDGDGSGEYWTDQSELPKADDGYLTEATNLKEGKMADLVVKTEGEDALGSTTFIGVDVWINEEIHRSSQAYIILSNDSLYTVKVQANITYESEEWNFTHWEDNNSTDNPRTGLSLGDGRSITAIYNLAVNIPPETPDAPVGPTEGNTSGTYTYNASTIDRNGDNITYKFRWGDGSTTTVGPYPSNVTVNASKSWGSPHDWSVKVRAKDEYCDWGNWSDALIVHIESSSPPGCPFISVWDGAGYVIDNNVLGDSEVSGGADVEDYYRLEQTLVPTYQGDWFSWYSLQISEFENEHSYIDKVRLYAVDHDPNVNMAVTPDGEFLTYTNSNPPISAMDRHNCDYLPVVLEQDDIYYRGFPGDYLLVDFGSLDISEVAKLVLRANWEWKKVECIHVQTLNQTGGWMDASVLRTRNNWSTIIVDLGDYLPNPDGTLKIRLYFDGVHKIDYVGLDTTPQAEITKTIAYAVYANHSTNGYITLKLLWNDQVCAELLPGEQIELRFILLNTEKTRTFIIYIEGHYETIE